MKHRIFTILSALSLGLCLISAGVWGRSYWRGDTLGWESAIRSDGTQKGGSLQSGGGAIWLAMWTRQYNGQGRPSGPGGFSRSTGSMSPGQRALRQMYLASLGASQFMGFAFYQRQMDLARPRSDGKASSTTLPQAMWLVVLPYWSLTALAAVPPGIWYLRQHRRRLAEQRMKLGLCRHCGYDLRASKERCPECGTAISGQVASSGGTA